MAASYKVSYCSHYFLIKKLRKMGEYGEILRQSNYLGELANRCFGTWDLFFRVCVLMKRQIESLFIKMEWKCHDCPLRYQPQNHFLELSKSIWERDEYLCFLLWRWTIGSFLYFPPVLEYSLILAIYFSLDFGKIFLLIVQILN